MRHPGLLLLASLLIASCSADGTTHSGDVGDSPDAGQQQGEDATPAEEDIEEDTAPPGPEPLELDASPAPFDTGGVATTFVKDITYGPHERNAFDILMPDSETSTPLILYIHGGGFTGGDKDGVWDDVLAIQPALDAGVAFASSTYRILEGVDSDGVLKPLTDSRRALQFIRYHAKSFNIDKDRIAAYGGSAGAGTCLWLGTRDDMADPESDDPVLRQSTRLTAVGAFSTQSTYDLVRWETEVFKEFGVTLQLVTNLSPQLAQRLYSFYGVSSLDELFSDALVAYRESVDILLHMDANDAPILVSNGLDYTGVPLTLDHFFHHPNHAKVLKAHADEVGLENQVHIPALNVTPEAPESMTGFLLRHLLAE